MKINFELVLKRLDGTSIPERSDITQCPNCGFKDGKIVEFGQRTLKSVAIEALQFNFTDALILKINI